MWFVCKITTIITSSWYYTSMSLLTYLWKRLNVIWKVKPGYQHYFTVRQPQIYLCKGKSEHRNKDIACRGKRKEEKSSVLAFNLITHSSWSTCRPEVIFIHRVHRGQWNNQQGTSPSENREAWGQTHWKKTSQIKKKKVGWHINPLSFISIHAHIDLDVSECC